MREFEINRVSNLRDPSDPEGRTRKEINLSEPHNIPVGTLVEARFDQWFGDGACWKVHARLWVVEHTRDCDGTPMYSLSRWKDPKFSHSVLDVFRGFSEQQLTPVEVTADVKDGVGALEW